MLSLKSKSYSLVLQTMAKKNLPLSVIPIYSVKTMFDIFSK